MMTRILAKSSGETLSQHTISCLKAAKRLIDSLPLSEDIRKRLENDVLLAVAFHDVGKAAGGFQRVLKGEQKTWNGKRHEVLSAALASAIPGASPFVVFAILTHHRSIPSDGITGIFGCLYPEQIPLGYRQTPVWKEMAGEWEDNCDRFLREWREIAEYLGQSLSVSCELKTLSIDPSWLDRTSGSRGQRKAISFDERYYASLVRGLVIASDHLGSTARLPAPIPEYRGYPIFGGEKKKPRPFQKKLGTIEGSATLRAPTGSGKTEAAILWAQKNQNLNTRLFYVLPYTASINAMYRRLRKIFGENVGLLHHRATASLYQMLADDADTLSHLDKQDIAKTISELSREMYFPIRVCTPHQILRHTLRGKGWEAMLAEFPQACFIFDEIHAYDPRVVGLTLASANLLGKWGCHSLFLSATLPEFLYQLIREVMGDIPFVEPDPNQNEDKQILDRKRHWITVEKSNILDHVEEVVESCSESPSTLIVCNHVSSAQKVYSEIKRRIKTLEPEKDIVLLHSRFTHEDRTRKESIITRSKKIPKILVATQVVEVSLDIDFEKGYLEPAPIDALAQRMGRINRLAERPPANIVVFTEQIGSYNLYCNCHGANHQQDCIVKRTLDEVNNAKNPVSEEDLIKIADIVYRDGYQGEDRRKFEQGLNHPDIVNFEDRLIAGIYQDWVEEIIERTDGAFEVLPESLLEEYERKRDNGLWIEANSLLVPVRFRSLLGLRNVLNTKADPWQVYCPYSYEEGLKVESASDAIIM
ncbi:CRISPR-associated helicase Cas3' [Dehalococcoidia bacterium]|nr:CRISPR-associated helicase Cas3' [Dehalococcoidia bacterium]